MKKVLIVVLCMIIIMVALCSCTPEPRIVTISSILSDEEATNSARAGLADSAAANEVDYIECELDYNTITYRFYYNSVTEDTINDRVIEIWDQYATDSAQLSSESIALAAEEINNADSNAFLLYPVTFNYEFYNYDGSVLFYSTDRNIEYDGSVSLGFETQIKNLLEEENEIS